MGRRRWGDRPRSVGSAVNIGLAPAGSKEHHERGACGTATNHRSIEITRLAPWTEPPNAVSAQQRFPPAGEGRASKDHVLTHAEWRQRDPSPQDAKPSVPPGLRARADHAQPDASSRRREALRCRSWSGALGVPSVVLVDACHAPLARCARRSSTRHFGCKGRDTLSSAS